MRVGVERGRHGGSNGGAVKRRRQAGAVAALFFIWLILLVSRMRLSSATVRPLTNSAAAAAHRKTHIFETEEIFKPPARLRAGGGDKNDVVYEDEKRVVHTGPNPLHN